MFVFKVTATIVVLMGMLRPLLAVPVGARRVNRLSGLYILEEEMTADGHAQYDILKVAHHSERGEPHYLTIQNLGDDVNAEPGVSTLTISVGYVLGDNLWIADGATVEVSNSGAGGRTRRATPAGVQTVLAIRVVNPASFGGDGPEGLATTAALSDAVFGTGGNTFNCESQFAACSHTAVGGHTSVDIEPASGAGVGTGLSAGTVEVTATIDVRSVSFGTLINHVEPLVDAAVGGTADNMFDLLMVFGPGGFAGTAFLPGQWSRYRGEATRHVSTMLHELGHNFGLHHSNELAQADTGSSIGEYDDTTGAMGNALIQTDPRGPKQCFNNAKNYELGWFSSRSPSVASGTCTGSTQYRLLGVVNYDQATGDDVMVVRVTGFQVPAHDENNPSATTSGSYYIGFNLDAGAHSGTREAQNRVTIQSSPTSARTMSNIHAKLQSGGSFALSGTITLTVDQIDTSANPPFALVTLQCPGASPTQPPSTSSPTTPPPTDAPTTQAPTTPPPTNAPTTPSPTSSPTLFPTLNPTLVGCGDGVCAGNGETCNTCGIDCASGNPSSTCGNGICEAWAGETCQTCQADCPKQRGTCCGKNGDCSASVCSSSGLTCSTSSPGQWCCGDGVCGAGETCTADCGAGPTPPPPPPPTSPTSAPPPPPPTQSCQPTDFQCTANSDCCSGNCRTNGRKRNTCS